MFRIRIKNFRYELQIYSDGNCIPVTKHSPTIPVDEEKLRNNNYDVRKSYNGCYYTGSYTRFNELFNYPTQSKYPILVAPRQICPQKSGRDILIIFGIKSMPGAFNTREAIRKTWLNHKYWNWPSLPVIPGQIQDRIIIKVRFVHLELIVLSTYITYISNLAYIYIFSLNLYI